MPRLASDLTSQASVSLAVKQRGHVFLPLEQMSEFSNVIKAEKTEVPKSWCVTWLDVAGTVAAFGDPDGWAQYCQAAEVVTLPAER